MIVDKRPDGAISVRLESHDWNRGGHSFKAVLKQAIPASYFDGKSKCWVVPEMQAGALVNLVDKHFGYKIERLLA